MTLLFVALERGNRKMVFALSFSMVLWVMGPVTACPHRHGQEEHHHEDDHDRGDSQHDLLPPLPRRRRGVRLSGGG